MLSVLVGDTTLGNSSYRRPPEKSSGVLYDSVTDNLNNPTMFIIFENYQAYPLYIINYK